jgi:hypothetical protein
MLLRVSRENGMPPRKAAEDMVRPPVHRADGDKLCTFWGQPTSAERQLLNLKFTLIADAMVGYCLGAMGTGAFQSLA